MLRLLSLALLAVSFVGATTLLAEDFVWAKEHPEARDRLLKIFEKYEGFREAITTFSVDHHGIFKELVEYLAEKHEHTVASFIKARNREDKETPHLERIHEKHREGMEAFREFVKDHKDAAISLTRHERELEHLERVAEKHDR